MQRNSKRAQTTDIRRNKDQYESTYFAKHKEKRYQNTKEVVMRTTFSRDIRRLETMVDEIGYFKKEIKIFAKIRESRSNSQPISRPNSRLLKDNPFIEHEIRHTDSRLLALKLKGVVPNLIIDRAKKASIKLKGIQKYLTKKQFQTVQTLRQSIDSSIRPGSQLSKKFRIGSGVTKSLRSNTPSVLARSQQLYLRNKIKIKTSREDRTSFFRKNFQDIGFHSQDFQDPMSKTVLVKKLDPLQLMQRSSRINKSLVGKVQAQRMNLQIQTLCGYYHKMCTKVLKKERVLRKMIEIENLQKLEVEVILKNLRTDFAEILAQLKEQQYKNEVTEEYTEILTFMYKARRDDVMFKKGNYQNLIRLTRYQEQFLKRQKHFLLENLDNLDEELNDQMYEIQVLERNYLADEPTIEEDILLESSMRKRERQLLKEYDIEKENQQNRIQLTKRIRYLNLSIPCLVKMEKYKKFFAKIQDNVPGIKKPKDILELMEKQMQYFTPQIMLFLVLIVIMQSTKQKSQNKGIKIQNQELYINQYFSLINTKVERKKKLIQLKKTVVIPPWQSNYKIPQKREKTILEQNLHGRNLKEAFEQDKGTIIRFGKYLDDLHQVLLNQKFNNQLQMKFNELKVFSNINNQLSQDELSNEKCYIFIQKMDICAFNLIQKLNVVDQYFSLQYEELQLQATRNNMETDFKNFGRRDRKLKTKDEREGYLKGVLKQWSRATRNKQFEMFEEQRKIYEKELQQKKRPQVATKKRKDSLYDPIDEK